MSNQAKARMALEHDYTLQQGCVHADPNGMALTATSQSVFVFGSETPDPIHYRSARVARTEPLGAALDRIAEMT
jgi:hypothetical protein